MGADDFVSVAALLPKMPHLLSPPLILKVSMEHFTYRVNCDIAVDRLIITGLEVVGKLGTGPDETDKLPSGSEGSAASTLRFLALCRNSLALPSVDDKRVLADLQVR